MVGRNRESPRAVDLCETDCSVPGRLAAHAPDELSLAPTSSISLPRLALTAGHRPRPKKETLLSTLSAT